MGVEAHSVGDEAFTWYVVVDGVMFLFICLLLIAWRALHEEELTR